MMNFSKNGLSRLFTLVLSASLLTLSFGAYAAPMSGPYTIGPTGNYASLTLAAAALHTNGVNGAVTMQIQSTYNVSAEGGAFPIVFSSIAGTSAANNVVIEPASGATGLVVTGSNATAIIQFSGVSYVTIDGRPGGTGGSSTTSGYQVSGALQIINTNTSAVSTIEFVSDAQNNTLQYCNVQGSSTLHDRIATTGVVWIGAGVTNGNDNNNILNCDIHNGAAGAPLCGIASYNNLSQDASANTTSLVDNDGVKIQYNNIYGFSPITTAAANDTSAGIYISRGNNSYNISNNAIYEPSAITLTGTAANTNIFAGILILADSIATAGASQQYGGGHTIANNYIGSQSAQTVPSTQTTSPLTISSPTALRFFGILLGVSTTISTTVSGNQVSNISMTTAGATTGSLGEFQGITLLVGEAGISNNIIGLPTTATVTNTTSNILVSFTSTNCTANGISLTPILTLQALTISGNTINSMTMSGPGAGTTNIALTGIFEGAPNNSSMMIGGATPALGNTVSYLTVNNAMTKINTGYATGMYINATLTGATIQNNTFHDIVNNAPDSVAPSSSMCAAGIMFTGGTAYNNKLISNTFYNISNGLAGGTAYTSANYTPSVAAIYLNCAATNFNIIAKNLIANIDIAMWQPSVSALSAPVAYGIYEYAGKDSMYNNMILLGYNTSGTAGASSPYPINFVGIYTTSALILNASFNSIYIGGTETHATTLTAANSYTACMASPSSNTNWTFQDNILENARTSTAGQSNFCVVLPTLTTAPHPGYNDYYYPGSNFAYYNGAPVATWSNTWNTNNDAGSITTNPLFNSPSSALVMLSSSPLNLDLQNSTSPAVGAGSAWTATQVQTDIHGATRSSVAGAGDMGADYVALPSCATPTAQPTALILNPGTISMAGSFTAASPVPTGGYLVVQYAHGATATAPVNNTVYTVGGSLGTGKVVGVGSATTFSASGLTSSTTYDYYVYSYSLATGCSGPIYDLSSPLTGSASTTGCGTASALTGIVPIGPSYTANNQTGFTNLTNALTWFSAYGMSAATTFSLQSNYTSTTETFPIVIPVNGCTTYPLLIEPAAGATGLNITTTASTFSDAIQFNGATYVTIDGRPGGTGGSTTTSGYQVSGALQIINTNTTANSTIRFMNDAQNNAVQYCNVQGSSINHATTSSVSAATVFIDAGVTNGNDNNTIQYCDIHASSAGLPVTAIGSYNNAGPGTVKDNDGVQILYNNIYDFSTQAVTPDTAAGIFISTGNNTYTISNNSIYETGAVSMSGLGTMFSFILVNTDKAATNQTYGSGFTIANNYCGGSAAQCGGSAMSLTGASTLRLLGIYATLGNGALSTINSNTVSNINFTTGAATTGVAGDFSGISAVYGNYTITNNTIGGATANNITVTLTASGGTITGIGMAGGYAGFNLPATGNTINNMTVTSASNATYGSLVGIYSTLGTGNFTIGGASSALGNTISNLTDGPAGGTATSGQALGIYVVEVGANTFTIQNNSIHDIVCNELNSLTSGTDYNACAGGVVINAGSATNTVSSNTIYNILNGGNANTSVAYYPLVAGIVEAANNCTVSGNLIYSLDAPKWTPSGSATNIPTVTAIDLYEGGGNNTIVNNMVRLGINNAGASSIYPINFYGINVGQNVFGNVYTWFNSVYIGGAETGATTLTATSGFNSTAAFISNDYTIMDLRNNIFDNSRTSAGGTPHNYSVNLYNAYDFTLNYNDYYYPGSTTTGNYFAINGSGVDQPVWTSGWTSGDVNSITGNPLFSSPAGAFTTTAPLNLDISSGTSPIIGAGVAISGVTTDYHGTTRATYNVSPRDDIGADVVALSFCTTPTAQPTALVLTPGISVISGSFTAASPAVTGYLVVQYAHGATPTAPTNLITYTVGSALGTGTIVAVTTVPNYMATGLAATTTYDYYIYGYNAGSLCIGPEYDLTSPLSGSSTTIGCGSANALTGTVPVGPAYTANNQTGFTNLTNALNWISNYGLNAATTLSLQNNYTCSTETFPIVFGNNQCITAAKPLTVRPAAGATGLTITSANPTATVQFSGANYVTIDGRPGGTGTSASGAITGDLTIINTATNDTGTVLIGRSSQNITVKYCDIQGSSNIYASATVPVSAVVYIGSTLNSNDSINYNNIHSYGNTNLPLCGIGAYSSTGTANDNANNTIDHNNIYDFSALASANSTNGIWIATGNDAYTITNNSLYESPGVAANQTMNGNGVIFRYIYVGANSGSLATSSYSGFNVSNNYMGGTAPKCGGAAYTLSGSNLLSMVPVSIGVGNGTQTIINGDSIANISMNVYNYNSGATGAFSGINVFYGNVAITNNMIGGAAANSISVTPTTSGSSVCGIAISGGAANTIPVTGNVINNISQPGASFNYGSLYGIYLSAASPTISVGGSTAALGNQISNLTQGAAGSTSSSGQVIGLYVSGTMPNVNIQYNNIFKLTNNTPSASSGANACVMGMYLTNTAGTTYNLYNNAIYNLQNTASTSSTTITMVMYGIYVNGAAACSYNLNANLIHSFDYPNWTPSGTVTGQSQIVGVAVSGGIMTMTNNMVRLGINASGTSVDKPMFMVGFYRSASATQAYTLQFNSVYIGGTTNAAYPTTSTTFYSSAFDNRPTAGALDVRNNIFENVRSSIGTGGLPNNYAFSHNNTSLPTTYNINYNDYYVSGTGSYLARNNTTNISSYSGISAVFTSDVSSQVGDPLYINPAGNSASVNLAINYTANPPSPADANGVAIGAVTTDFYGNTRANMTPTDIGADAFVGMKAGNNGNPGICLGSTLNLNDTIRGTLPVGTTFSWTGPNGFSAATQAASVSSMLAADTGVYYVTATFPGGSTETDSTIVTLNPAPAAVASNTGPYYSGATITLSSGPASQTSYAWSGPAGFTSSIQNPTRTTATTAMGGAYTVTVTGANGCSASATTNVVVNNPNGYTWTGTTSTAWTTPTNWTPNSLPGGPSGCTVSVIIQPAANSPIISTPVSIGDVTMNSNAQLTLNASLSTCGSVTGGSTSTATILGNSSLIMTGSSTLEHMSGIITVNNLTINESPGVVKSGTLTINKVLTITSGNFNNTSGTVTLVSNASGDAYLDNFTSPTAGAYIGNMTVQRYISNTADGYRDLSSPVSTTVADLNAAYPVTGQNAVDCYYSYSPYPNVQIYNEPLHLVNGSYDEHWVSYTALTNNLGPTRGVAFRTYVGSPYTISFNGPPYNGTEVTNITHTTTATPSNDGFNLIGNPYPSPVRWSLIKGMNGGGLNGSYYVNHTSGAYTGTWGSYNGVTGVNGAGDVISIGQGFFVQTTVSGSITMNNTVRTGNPSLGYYAPQYTPLDNEIRLILSNSSNTNSDEIVTYTDPQGTNGFDPLLDAIKMPAASKVYVGFHMSTNDYYAINVIDTITDQTEIPLTLYASDTGSFNLATNELNVQNMTTFLKDNQTGTLTTLSTGSVNSIPLIGGQVNDRYSLVFRSNASPSGITNTTEAATRIYSSGDNVYVKRTSNTPATISVMNVIGQSIRELKTNTETTVFELPTVEPWYAIVKVTEGSKVTVAKVLISNK